VKLCSKLTVLGPGDISAHDAECLGKCALKDGDAIGNAVALGDSAAMRTMKAETSFRGDSERSIERSAHRANCRNRMHT
jgi:hypothetical protein